MGRLAKGTDGVEREWMPRELYMLYAQGFRDGAGTKAMRATHTGIDAYARGYDEGRAAFSAATQNYADEIGYEPTVLRAATPAPGKEP